MGLTVLEVSRCSLPFYRFPHRAICTMYLKVANFATSFPSSLLFFPFHSRRLPVQANAIKEASVTMTTITDDTPAAASPLTTGFTVRSRKVKVE